MASSPGARSRAMGLGEVLAQGTGGHFILVVRSSRRGGHGYR
jgi:hypothetical protein